MDAAPSMTGGRVLEELAPARRVASKVAARRVTSAARCFWTALFFLAESTAALRDVLLCLAMVLMMGKEPIASEQGEFSSDRYELEWPSVH